LFGFYITHILNTGCAKICKKIRRQKVNKCYCKVCRLTEGNAVGCGVKQSIIKNKVIFN
jgi:hypothetical protein